MRDNNPKSPSLKEVIEDNMKQSPSVRKSDKELAEEINKKLRSYGISARIVLESRLTSTQQNGY